MKFFKIFLGMAMVTIQFVTANYLDADHDILHYGDAPRLARGNFLTNFGTCPG